MSCQQNNKKDQIVRKMETAAANLRALSLCTNTLLQEILFLCVLTKKLVAADALASEAEIESRKRKSANFS